MLGAGLALFGVWFGVRRRDRADQRAEWRQRFEIALGELADGTDPLRRSIGLIMLRSLATSSLATDEDRKIAGALLAYAIDHDPATEPVGTATHALDEPAASTDNRSSDSTGGAR